MTTPTTTPNRAQYGTDVSDEEWQIWETYLPKHNVHPNFPEPAYTVREILNAVLHGERTGCQWRNLPHDFPPWPDVYYHFRKWRDGGVLERTRDALRRRVRIQEGRQPEPSLAIVDSQAVKGTTMTEESGYDGGKKVKGRKRHLLVDTLGLLLAVAVTAASVQDRDGFVMVVRKPHLNWPRMKKVLVDSAYNGEPIENFVREHQIPVEVTKPPPGQKGFVVVQKRWVVERTNGLNGWERILAKCVERLPESEAADINLAACRRMIRQLTGNQVKWRQQSSLGAGV